MMISQLDVGHEPFISFDQRPFYKPGPFQKGGPVLLILRHENEFSLIVGFLAYEVLFDKGFVLVWICEERC